MEHRLRHVESYIRDSLSPVLRLDPYPADTWRGSINGWEPPEAHEGLFVFRYSPAVIAGHTADLFADDCDAYLRSIVACVHLYVIHHDVPADRRKATVENDLYEQAPGSVELLSRMEMAILDASS